MAPLMWNTKVKEENWFNLTHERPDKQATISRHKQYLRWQKEQWGKDLWKSTYPSKQSSQCENVSESYFKECKKLPEAYSNLECL